MYTALDFGELFFVVVVVVMEILITFSEKPQKKVLHSFINDFGDVVLRYDWELLGSKING